MAADHDKIIHRDSGVGKIFVGSALSGAKRERRPPGPWDCSVCGLPVGKEGIAKGMAAVSYKGKMVDTPVYDNARTILKTMEEIAAFDKKRKG